MPGWADFSSRRAMGFAHAANGGEFLVQRGPVVAFVDRRYGGTPLGATATIR